jgi:hypothetical protein
MMVPVTWCSAAVHVLTRSSTAGPAVSGGPGTVAVPAWGDWDLAPLTLRRKPDPASTVKPQQVRHQVMRLPTEPAAAHVEW